MSEPDDLLAMANGVDDEATLIDFINALPLASGQAMRSASRLPNSRRLAINSGSPSTS